MVLVTMLSLIACATPPAPEARVAVAAAPTEAYGEAFTVDQVVAASALLADPARYDGQTVRVAGRVADVCQKAGCWMVIAEGDKSMRVRMKDHGFAVAKDAAGTSCQVQGTVVSHPVDPETVAHFASESSEGAPVPEHAAAAGARVYEIIATGVQVTRS